MKRIEAWAQRLIAVVINAADPVEAEAVDVVLVQPEAHDILKIACSLRLKVIPVHTAPHVDAGGRVVKEGVPARPPFALWPIQWRVDVVIGMVAPGVVEGYIQDHGDSGAVTGIHKALEVVWAAIRVGDGMIEDRVVAPARLAWKRLDRHQLHAVDAKPG